MESISKEKVIDLFNAINLDGIDSAQWVISHIPYPMDAHAEFGGDAYMSFTLKEGIYIAIYSQEPDVSDYPKVENFVNSLNDENFEIIPNNDDESIVIVCLDRAFVD